MRPPLNAGENTASSPSPAPPPPRFNEAPAERGGELEQQLGREYGKAVASMRPPLNAGENKTKPPPPVRAKGRASMRPPLNAGENNASRVSGKVARTSLQ